MSHSEEQQFAIVFFGRGRRTQEAIKEYFKDVMDRLYLHSDGAKMYKCYNIAGLIIRISCLVHMRRPFFKLKDVSHEAAKRLARLLSHFANCKDHQIDSFTYLCDVFRRIKNTAKEDLVYLLEHRWQPMPALALA